MKRRTTGCLFGLDAASVWWFFFSEFMAIDRCLDAGGPWANGRYCEGARVGE